MRGYIDRVSEVLEENNCKYNIINYPEGNKKAVDIVATTQDKRLFIIRVPPDDKISKMEISDLKNMSKASNAIPLYITTEADENFVIKKDIIVGVSIEGLMRILKGEKMFVYKTRGGIFVKINNKKFKEEKEKLRLSLGELANVLGVSRKTIYDYERGFSDVTIEVAEKLVEIFGEEVLGDILSDIPEELASSDVDNDNNEKKSNDSLEEKIKNELKNANYKIYELSLAPIDIVGIKKDKEKSKLHLLAISVEPKNKDPNIVLKKAYEGNKIAKAIGSDFLIVTRTTTTEKLVNREGFKTYTMNNITELRDEIDSNN
ncbi:MAG: helix-turn-helix domain-containing protein [Sulfolobaceae archaeon]|nr:helix-turn-helix domain-containing protein [Sulfolobaceae archaeon]